MVAHRVVMSTLDKVFLKVYSFHIWIYIWKKKKNVGFPELWQMNEFPSSWNIHKNVFVFFVFFKKYFEAHMLTSMFAS